MAGRSSFRAEPVGLAWNVLLGFLRLTTRANVLPKPLEVEQASVLWIPGSGCPLSGSLSRDPVISSCSDSC